MHKRITAAVLSAFALGSTAMAAEPNAEELRALANNLFKPIPAADVIIKEKGLTPEQIELGQWLWFEPRLSRSHIITCNTCHSVGTGGADNIPTSVGHGWQHGPRNSPTVLNAVFNIAQFWDGRAATQAEQFAGPLHSPVEMASSWAQALERLSAVAEYRDAFARIYPDGITEASITDAIVSFERRLITPDAPFDRYLRGEQDAMAPDAIEGYARFKDYGCASCHQGAGIGGNMFQRFGIMGDYFADRGNINAVDHGRYNVTGREEDRHVFKVPSLRNVALTPPYFHDGSIATLDEAVRVMGRYQLGREISGEDRRLIVAFLGALTGEMPRQSSSTAAR